MPKYLRKQTIPQFTQLDKKLIYAQLRDLSLDTPPIRKEEIVEWLKDIA